MKRFHLPRRGFLSAATAGLATFAAGRHAAAAEQSESTTSPSSSVGNASVKVISSANGEAATRHAYQLLASGADTLDAVVAGVELVENDPSDMSVGYGGLPNERGIVELDAAVMHGPSHRAGSVAALRNIKNPAQVAVRVMKMTDHELLVGAGALEFARACGFQEENLLTDAARKVWLHWKQTLSDHDDWLEEPKDPETAAFFRDHSETVRVAGRVTRRFRRPTGTIHCAAIDAQRNISCTTTTSGLAFKIPGRVGDSPIIGAGLYVDNEIGSCGSTGRGEANLQNLCSFAAVELMRGGMSPRDAGLEICRRVASHTKRPDLLDDRGRPNFGLKFYLLDKSGRHAGVSLHGPAKFAVTDDQGTRLEECDFLYEKPRHG